MMKAVKKYFSLFFLFVFVSGITPEYLIHEFTDHTDTFDSCSNVPSFGEQHHHCDSLLLQLESFHAAENIHVSFLSVIISERLFPAPESAPLIPVNTLSLRGPPAVV